MATSTTYILTLIARRAPKAPHPRVMQVRICPLTVNVVTANCNCRQFYHLGWVTGTGGGITIKKGYVWNDSHSVWNFAWSPHGGAI
jgi:hypothetical protein